MGLIKPEKYVHPNKRKRGEVAEEKHEPTQGVEPSKAVKEKLENERVASSPTSNPQKKSASETAQIETVTIRLLARAPQIGQTQIYDEMLKEGLSDREAIFGMMSKGLALLDNGKGRLDEAEGLEMTSTVIETRRTIDAELFASLKSRFDKFDILSERALGLKVGEALISLVGKDGSDE